jgi:hypothetical protein
MAASAATTINLCHVLGKKHPKGLISTSKFVGKSEYRDGSQYFADVIHYPRGKAGRFNKSSITHTTDAAYLKGYHAHDPY